MPVSSTRSPLPYVKMENSILGEKRQRRFWTRTKSRKPLSISVNRHVTSSKNGKNVTWSEILAFSGNILQNKLLLDFFISRYGKLLNVLWANPSLLPHPRFHLRRKCRRSIAQRRVNENFRCKSSDKNVA